MRACVCVCVRARDWMVASNTDSPPFAWHCVWWWCLRSLTLLLQLDGLCCLRAFVVCDWTLWSSNRPLIEISDASETSHQGAS